MCGTGDISVCDFKAHAVVVGGSWHFREKVGEKLSPSCLLSAISPTTEAGSLNWEQLSWLEIRLTEGQTGRSGSQEHDYKHYEITFLQRVNLQPC